MHDPPTCGSLFSGTGLLDCGLAMAGFEHAWVCESDEFRRGLLAKRFPGAVVYDDIRTLRGQAAADADGIDRSEEHARHDGIDRERQTNGRRAVEPAGTGGLAAADGGRLPGAHAPAGPVATGYASPVDLIAGGFPCKGASSAGKQNGFEHAETVLWHEMRRVIGEVRPRYVVIENVANILGMATAPGEPAGSIWGTVLGDLAALGFGDIRWDVLPSAAVGAPHLRERVFAVAAQSAGTHAERDGGQRRRTDGWPDVAGDGDRAAAYAEREPVELRGGAGAVGEAPAGGGGAPRQQRDGGSAANRDQDAAADADGAGREGHGGTVGVRAQVAGADRVHDRAAADPTRDAEGGASSPAGADGERTRSRAGQVAADAAQAGRLSPIGPGQQRGMGRDTGAGGDAVSVDWGDYQPAISRWEAVHGPAPEPLVRRLDDGNAKLRRVRARVDRSRLSALGDGVHVYCAYLVGLAIRHHMRHGKFG